MKRNKVQTEFKIPITIGRKSMDIIFQEDKEFKKYDYDFQLMYEKGIITEWYFIEEIIFSFSVFFKHDVTKYYRVIPKNTETEFKIVYNEDDYDYWIVDITKKFNRQEQRKTNEYKRWRDKVYKRDKWTCQHCGKRGRLNAHHIKSFKDFPKLRLDVNNGLTLCVDCHRKEHKRLRGENNARLD